MQETVLVLDRSAAAPSGQNTGERCVHLIADSISDKSWLRSQKSRMRQDLEKLVHQTRILSRAMRRPRVPWYAQLVAGCAVGYLMSPIQIIPTFIPIIGQLDDLFVLFIGMKVLRKWTPDSVLAECEAQASDPSFFGGKRNPGELATLAEKQKRVPAA